jgi:hypothetical protein
MGPPWRSHLHVPLPLSARPSPNLRGQVCLRNFYAESGPRGPGSACPEPALPTADRAECGGDDTRTREAPAPQHLVVFAKGDASASAIDYDSGMNLAPRTPRPAQKAKLIPRFSLHA